MAKADYGVVIGRWQVHQLTEGHVELIERVSNKHSRVIVFIGCVAGVPTVNNPLDYVSREQMIRARFPDVYIAPIMDCQNDRLWSERLDASIASIVGNVPAAVTLYGGRDSFAPHYLGRHKVTELDLATPIEISATKVRLELSNTVMKSADFRAGIIYGSNLGFPKVYPTVDIAATHGDMILMGRKPGESKWRFPGGFVEANGDLEANAIRELFEETGLSVTETKYIASQVIDDWRYAGTPDKIMTTLFQCETANMGAIASDDLEEVRWFKINEIQESDIVAAHDTLFATFKTKWNLRK